MFSRRRGPRGRRLFALYVLASLVPISVIGVAGVRGDSASGREFIRDWGRAQAVVIEQMAIAPALRGGDLSLGLSKTERARLQSATDLAIFNGTVSHLRLRSFMGTVEFSDNGILTGSVPVTDPAFRSAAAGRTDSQVIDTQPGFRGVVRVLQTVTAAANGRATGVLEVYLPYDAIATKAQEDARNEAIRLALSLVGLFAFLALVSWWTTRALRQSAAAHEYESLHDSLTGLPNRELFRRTAEDALERGKGGEKGALVLIDLDHFKEVNDTLGHHAGDELLWVVGRRLREALRTDDTVARLGGDEFAMVLPHAGDRQEVVDLLSRIQGALGEEVVLDGVSVTVEASFGICFYPDSAETVEDLLQHADAAMYQGKKGPGEIVIYQETTPHRARHALSIQRELRTALARDELVLHYQPKVWLSSGQVTSLEALIRWQHPERGLLLPAEFLQAAERGELNEPLAKWVLRHALADYAAWTAAGFDWTVAVNVSARNLRSPQFAGSVRQILSEAEVLPGRLDLEVNQSALALDAESARTVISELAEEGISIAMDHFGIGLTDLARFCTVNISEIKIDRTFLGDLPGDEQDRAIVRSVIDLCHSLGCVVTAEGVESQQVADALEEAGCDAAQGYLWHHPSPWTEVATAFGSAAAGTAAATSKDAPSDASDRLRSERSNRAGLSSR